MVPQTVKSRELAALGRRPPWKLDVSQEKLVEFVGIQMDLRLWAEFRRIQLRLCSRAACLRGQGDGQE